VRAHLAAACALVVLAVAAAGPLAGQAPAPTPRQASPATPTPAQQPAFRSDIDLVSLNITVTDSSGRYVTDLTESEFQVFENGAKQQITFFSRRQNPIALSLLLDSSASMEFKLPVLQAAAANFVKRLKPGDLAQIVDFDGGFYIRQDFTANQKELEQGIYEKITPGGPTALHNAIYVGLAELRKLPTTSEEEPRRQALIVFSDGMDTSSLVSIEEVLDRAKRSEVAIYAIGLREATNAARGFQSAEYVLRQLAAETGGRAFFPNNISELNSVYGQIADELSNQYAVGYTSTNPRRDGAWRTVIVQTTRPSVAARTKKGYFAPSPTSSR
jgi:Ca-activated chloride channel family protein